MQRLKNDVEKSEEQHKVKKQKSIILCLESHKYSKAEQEHEQDLQNQREVPIYCRAYFKFILPKNVEFGGSYKFTLFP